MTSSVPSFTISSVSDESLSAIFSKELDIFGLKVYGTIDTSDEDIIHAGKIYAEYLDNNKDGIVDDILVVEKMISSKAILGMTKDQNETDSLDITTISNAGFQFQDLNGVETRPNGSSKGKFDATLEEVLHLITDYGYGLAYPEAFASNIFQGSFSETNSSLLTDAMDIARGGKFIIEPISYPSEAWYTFFDDTADYSTQASEYFYWGLTSILGAQEYEGRYEEIKDEWKLNTKDKVRDTDTKLYNLLTDTKYSLPTILPNGNYSVNDSSNNFEATILGTSNSDNLISTAGNDSIDGGLGIDTFSLSTKFSNYSFIRDSDTLQIADQRTGNNDGTDTLKNIEYIQFSDQTVESSKVDVVKKYSGEFSDYMFYNKGNGIYQIKTDSGYDDITGYPLLKFTGESTTSSFRDVSAIVDIKGTFDQVTGLNTDSGRMFRLYNASFKRLPDPDGLKYWINQFSSGANSIRVVASSFLGSAEFAERYGSSITDEKYVNTLYKNVLGRDADPSGLNYWLGQLSSGAETRYEVLLGFAESAENKLLFTEMTGLG